jgi:uncharacterized protein (TIGR02996 family)
MTASTVRDELLRDILADPFDDAPRRIYADWCEDEGDDHGNDGCVRQSRFIHAGIDLANDPPPHNHDDDHGAHVSGCPRCRIEGALAYWHEHLAKQTVPKLAGRVYHFSARGRFRPDIEASLADPRSPDHLASVFWWDRGFVSAVTITHDDFLKHAEALFRAHPITEVRLSDRRPEQVERKPGFAQYCWLNDWARPVAATVNRDLWRLMPGGWYWTDDAAHAALSRACVAYGRGLAGLPALTERSTP